jgi:CsoR family transcriptional regulator, copper-sensing transcriptional repressor
MQAMSQLIDPDKKRQMIQRLARVEGQLRGVQKLIHNDEDCEKVAQQLTAARKALDKSFFQMVACMLEQGDMPPKDVAQMLAKFS